MHSSQSSLLTQRRFLPYFITQFFGAFNDNIFKNVLLLFVAFAAVDTLSISSHLFINLAAGLFVLPFFLFSASAGVLADKYEKSWFIRRVKLFEIAIMCIGAIGFITQSYGLLLFMLFLMGTQSAFFGPVKYALLPHAGYVHEGELSTLPSCDVDAVLLLHPITEQAQVSNPQTLPGKDGVLRAVAQLPGGVLYVHGGD